MADASGAPTREPSDDFDKEVTYIKYDFSLNGGRIVVVDSRFWTSSRFAPGTQMRIAVSFGPAPRRVAYRSMSPERAMPPEGAMIFGCHHVGTKGRKLALFETWLDEEQPGVALSEESVLLRAKMMLAKLKDPMYQDMLTWGRIWPAKKEEMESGRSPFDSPWEEVHYEELFSTPEPHLF